MLTHMTEEEAWEMLYEAVTDYPHCFGINNLESIGLVEIVDEESKTIVGGANVYEVLEGMLMVGLISPRVLKLFGMLH